MRDLGLERLDQPQIRNHEVAGAEPGVEIGEIGHRPMVLGLGPLVVEPQMGVGVHVVIHQHPRRADHDHLTPLLRIEPGQVQMGRAVAGIVEMDIGDLGHARAAVDIGMAARGNALRHGAEP